MSAFNQKLNGLLFGIMRWSEWDKLVVRLRLDHTKQWYLSAAGADVPKEPASPAMLGKFLSEIDVLLKSQYEQDYLGIVYVDNVATPSLIKIYDPDNLGSACGTSGSKVEPGWVISQDRPDSEFGNRAATPANRKRWWNALRQTRV